MRKQISFVALCFSLALVVFIAGQAEGLNKSRPVGGNNILSNGFHMNFPDTTKKAAAGDTRDKGVGPIKEFDLGTIDQKMVSAGKGIFTSKCVLCHELDQKKIGPALRNIAKDRAPEYIMNMILNPTEMQKKDQAVKDLMKKYNNVPMIELGISKQQARTVLEYLRSVAK